METAIAALIFKNLFTTDINSSNINQIKADLKEFLGKNFDAVRHEIWVNSGKSTTFNSLNLKNSLGKYIQ